LTPGLHVTRVKVGVILGAVALLMAGTVRAEVPRSADQLIVAVAPDWGSHRVRLLCFGREGRGWRPAVFSSAVPALVGRSGLAWGRGVHAVPKGSTAPRKVERDGKAPAGVFAIGKVFGYEARLPGGSDYPYRQVTVWDAWVDDSKNPHYNRHVVVEPGKVPPWFDKQKMRHGDFAYHWLLEVRHNADPKPVPGAGSAIFFHIRRGEDRATAGCTTMERGNLEAILKWLRVKGRPHYVLLPRAEYEQLKGSWKLPDFAE
jgi:L,D-peptidoglycan transpeptidase YkuD (ErfK/YbiS/YcfS/YnhG family)